MTFPLSRLNPSQIHADWNAGELSIEASGEVTGTVTDLQIKRVKPATMHGDGGVGPALLPTFEVLGRVNPLPAIVAPFKAQASFQMELVPTIEVLTADGGRTVSVKGEPPTSAASIARPLPARYGVGQLELKNEGGYACRMEVDFKAAGQSSWQRVKMYGNLLLGQSHTCSPGDFGVNDGDSMRLFVDVVGGSSVTASEEFLYSPGGAVCASYVCSGTSLSPKISAATLN